MNIITVSREFGSGGRELGKRVADLLGYDYYDSEIISAIAKNSGLDENYVETTLDNHGWQDFPVSFGGTMHSVAYMQASKIDLLVQQKKVIEGIAALGKDCVIIGRNADAILKDLHPFSIFVCADQDAKIRRCRARTRDFLTGSEWGQCKSYHLTVNTGDWDMKELAKAVAAFAESWFSSKA